MTDYFNDYSALVGSKGLPSPADTPYETPSFIRSKRSSRATTGSSRGPSPSPPPLPPDASSAQDRDRDGAFPGVDPRRFTPTLHASLVAEILKLKRDLESKDNLVENLEASLSAAKDENETLNQKLVQHGKEVRAAKKQVRDMEKGTYHAVEGLIEDQKVARTTIEDLKSKLDVAQKTTKRQDEDALRTQQIWESDKENWESERRQLERRIHVTESRLRTFVDGIAAQQASTESRTIQVDEAGDESFFKDSALGNESDTGSIPSATCSPIKHRRNVSSISYTNRRSRILRNSLIDRNSGTPEPQMKPGHSLADELGIDEEDEYDIDEFDHADDELEYPEKAEHARRNLESRLSNVPGDADSKAKRVLGLTSEAVDQPGIAALPPHMIVTQIDSEAPLQPSEVATSPITDRTSKDFRTSRVQYVDSGYQPSPPPSPPRKDTGASRASDDVLTESPTPQNLPQHEETAAQSPNALRLLSQSPMSPPETPIIDNDLWQSGSGSRPWPTYATAATQTDTPDVQAPRTPPRSHVQRDSLGSPSLVPSIAIHPPSSRPATPLNYVLPPRTRNAATQANLAQPWPSRDVSIQTEEIRIDRRPVKLPPHLLPSYLLPSPTLSEPLSSKRTSAASNASIPAQPTAPPPPPPSSPPARSPRSDSPVFLREDSQKDLRSMPLRAIPLPRPILSPPMSQEEFSTDGPLNRSAKYGVTKSTQIIGSRLADVERDSDFSEVDDILGRHEPKNLAGSIPGLSKPLGRLGQFEPPKAVPEDKEISPERRPGTAESFGAAPAPSVASSRNSQHARGKQPVRSNHHKSLRSRSPSFGSMASSGYSTKSAMFPGVPPFPIPTRSSSRIIPNSYSEGSQSPTPHINGDQRPSRTRHNRQGSLRKVQSATAMRNGTRQASPAKTRRRRRSPELTPVQSMAFESPAPTNFPIPEIPTTLPSDLSVGGPPRSIDSVHPPTTAASSIPRPTQEDGLVDAIAATMVGEWMWKYIRKRKSFGVSEELSLAADDKVNSTSHGSRHRRWVWISPYERCIMWDSKQPTNGSALLGKKGRKLAIQSVLDVQDETPLPRNPELASAFNRSILILTPERALKFTAVSLRRHTLWMTALSFLAEGEHPLSQGLPLPLEPAAPPTPSVDSVPIRRHRAPSFGRAQVRDSIRLAKGKRPPIPNSSAQQRTVTDSGITAAEANGDDQGADFPSIPRLYISTTRHQRKRSNTAPRLPAPLNGLRSASSSAVPSTSSSVLHPASTNSSFRPPLPSASSKSGSRRESVTTPDQPNFFEAIGTVRMEAFVDPNVRDGVLYVPAPPGGNPPHRQRRGDNNLSQITRDKRRAGYVFDDFGLDPFRSF